MEGRVVEAESGEPIAEAMVWLEPLDENEPQDSVSSDEAGRFLLRPPTPGTYRVWVDAEGFEETSHPQVLELYRGSEQRVLVRLQPDFAIRGRLLGLTPEELGSVGLTAYPRTEHYSEHGAEVDRENGIYRVGDLHPGTWDVYARAEDPQRKVHGEVILEAGLRDAQLDLDFGKGYLLTGRVFHNGEPLPEAPVVVSERESGGMEQKTDIQGGFRYGSLEPGLSYVTVTLPEEIKESRTVDLTGDQEMEIQIFTTRVEGRVLTEEGAPAANVELTLDRAEVQGDGGFRETTDPDGRFKWESVVEGTYELRGLDASRGRVKEVVEIYGLETSLGDVVLDRGQPVTLQVRPTPASEGLKGEGVVLDAKGDVIASFGTLIGQGGLAPVVGIPAEVEGRELILRLKGYALARVPLQKEHPTPYPVDLTPGATIEIRNLEGTSGGVPWVEDLTGQWSKFQLMFLLDFHWRGMEWMSVTGLPAGRWRLTLPGGQTREVDLKSGETVEVALP